MKYAIDYSPFWETVKKKNMTQYELLSHGIDSRLLDRLRNNKNINMSTLGKICKLLECTPNDVVTFIPVEK